MLVARRLQPSARLHEAQWLSCILNQLPSLLLSEALYRTEKQKTAYQNEQPASRHWTSS